MRDRIPAGIAVVPVAITLGVIVTMAVLVLQITLRPWAGTDSGYDTHLNYSTVGDDYSRTNVARVGAAPDSPGWVPAPSADPEDPMTVWVGYGCASCHGLDGTSGLVGSQDIGEVTFEELFDLIREGPEGMPAYEAHVLGDDRIAGIAALFGINKPQSIAGSTATRSGTAPVPNLASTSTPAPLAPTPDNPATPAGEATSTATPGAGGTSTPAPDVQPSPTAIPDGPAPLELPVTVTAATASIVVDGLDDDWAAIQPASVVYKPIGPIPGKKVPDLDPITGQFSVATDDQNIYVMLQVDDDYDFVPGDRKRSSKVAVMFLIEPDAAPHMGTTEEDQRTSLGMVDIWHWTLDCGPGELAGGRGSGVSGGNDPVCNLDDEYALTPKDLEDDDSSQAENSLQGVWNHSGASGGNGSEGRWTFEFSRPLVTGDPHDVRLASGSTFKVALAYWDADESAKGWTDLGHLQTSWMGWIEVTLP